MIVITDIKTTANVINNVTVSTITKEIKNLLIIFLHYVLKGVDIRASLLEYCFKSPQWFSIAYTITWLTDIKRIKLTTSQITI